MQFTLILRPVKSRYTRSFLVKTIDLKITIKRFKFYFFARLTVFFILLGKKIQYQKLYESLIDLRSNHICPQSIDTAKND